MPDWAIVTITTLLILLMFGLWAAFQYIKELQTQIELLRIRMNYISTGRER